MEDVPAMGSQPNLASRSEVVSIYKCLEKMSEALPKFGAQKNKFWTTFPTTSALENAYLLNETSHRQTKMLVSIYNRPMSSFHCC